MSNLPALTNYTPAQLKLIRDTVASECNTQEFNLFIEICKHNGLDPFKKQIYAFVFKKTRKTKVNGNWTAIEERKLTTVTGIDGYRAMAQRSGNFRASDQEPDFEMAEKDPKLNPEGIVKSTVTLYQYGIDKVWHRVVGVARWSEYAPIVEDGKWVDMKFQGNGTYHLDPKKPNWRKMPFIMLAKCAEANALRKGWSSDVAGVYVQEEIDAAHSDQMASDAVRVHEEEARMARVAGPESIPIVLAMSDGLQLFPPGQFADKVLEHLNGFESADDVAFWKENNKMGLQQFWAKNVNEAMELKRSIEGIESRLREAESTEQEKVLQSA